MLNFSQTNSNQTLHSEICYFLKPRLALFPRVYAASVFGAILDLWTAPVAVIGNALVLYAFIKTPSLHLTSNYLLGCLAASDLVTGMIAAPAGAAANIGNILGNSYLYCISGVIFNCVAWFSCCSSFFTLCLISLERFLALRLHLRYKTIVTRRRLLMIMACWWGFTLAMNALRFWDRKLRILRPVIITVGTVQISMLTICYINIYRIVFYHRRQIQGQEMTAVSSSSRNSNSPRQRPLSPEMIRFRRNTVTMLCILGLFLSSFVPIVCIQAALIVFKDKSSKVKLRIAYRFCSSVTILSSSLNPLMYCYRMTDVRQAVKNILNKIKQELWCATI